jgi:peptide/nickel transport system substrate-binding protein
LANLALSPLRSRRLAAAGLACAALLCGGCGGEPGPAERAEAPRSGGTAIAATAADVTQWNDLLPGSSQFTADVLNRMIFSHLLEEQPDYAEHPPTFGPALGASYEWSPDHLVATVRLRQEATWSDGVPITAADVRFTWEAQTHPDVAWDYAYSKEHIRDVEVVDAHTVRFHFREAYFAQMTDLNEGLVLPKHAWEKLPFSEWRANPDWFRENLVSSGPYALESWTPQQEIVLRRNPRYFRPGLPLLERVVFRVVPDAQSQLAQLLAGRVDYVEQVQPAQAARVAGSEKAQLLRYPTRQFTFVCWNTRRELFAAPEVRRALTLAIDRQGIIDALWYGFARPADSPILTTVWAHNDALRPWPYDPEQARQLLEAAGFRDEDRDGVRERGGKRLAFELLTNVDNPTRVDAAVMIQEQLRRVGVEVKPLVLDFNTASSRITAHDFDATIMAFAIDTSLDLSYSVHSDSYTNGSNFGGYANLEVDGLLGELRRTTDPAAAKPIFDRLQEILHQEQPFTFLWEPDRLDGASRRLADARPNALSAFFNIREWWLREP